MVSVKAVEVSITMSLTSAPFKKVFTPRSWPTLSLAVAPRFVRVPHVDVRGVVAGNGYHGRSRGRSCGVVSTSLPEGDAAWFAAASIAAN